MRLNSKLSIEANRYIVKAVQEASCLRSEINMGLNPKLFLEDFNKVDKQGREVNALSVLRNSSKIFNRRNYSSWWSYDDFLTLFTARSFKDNSFNGTLGFAFSKVILECSTNFLLLVNIKLPGRFINRISKTLKKLKNKNELKSTY